MNELNALEKLASFLDGRGDDRWAGLSGKFHAHLSVSPTEEQMEACREFCRQNKIKLTVVDLEGTDRKQTDVMLTCHFRDPDNQAVDRITRQLVNVIEAAEHAGFPVCRAKLEHESLPSLPDYSEQNYHEVHIKLSMAADSFPVRYEHLKQLGSDHGFVPSRNPYQRQEESIVQFVNLRIYDGGQEQANAIVEEIVDVLRRNSFTVCEVKRETVVYDTARDLDAWWA